MSSPWSFLKNIFKNETLLMLRKKQVGFESVEKHQSGAGEAWPQNWWSNSDIRAYRLDNGSPTV